MIEVIMGDSMKIMPALKAKFDMIFLDPPYFDWATGESKPDHKLLSLYTYQLLKDEGVAFLCGTIPQLAEDWLYWRQLFNIQFELIVDKIIGIAPISIRTPSRTHENIWCLSKKGVNVTELKLDFRKAVNPIKLSSRRRKLDDSALKIRSSRGEEMRESVGYPKSIIQAQRITNRSKEYWHHPTQKPLKLMHLLIKISTDEGDSILDPFAGSGTTLIAAKHLNRSCLGIEINPEYVQIIKKRLRSEEEWQKLIQYM